MTCKNNKCEYSPTLRQQLTFKRTKNEERYGRLWAEIELPKLLEKQQQSSTKLQ